MSAYYNENDPRKAAWLRENIEVGLIAPGFVECFRVLKSEGTLIFKWNENDIPVSQILVLTPEKPLFGNKCGKSAKTHWIVFQKTMKTHLWEVPDVIDTCSTPRTRRTKIPMTTEPRLKYVTYVYEIVDAAKWYSFNPLKVPDRDGLHVMGISCSDLMGTTGKIEDIVNSEKSDEDKIAHIKTILSERFP